MNETVNLMIQEYHANLTLYNSMKNYYDGMHDIKYSYPKFPNRNNQIIVDNYVNKFINEEVQYSLGNPLSYVSLSGNRDMIDSIYKNLFHWKDNQNQKIMRTLEIYGKAYVLNYIDHKGRFSEKILTPLNAICYADDNGVPKIFIHFYKKKYDDAEYMDIYYSDGSIEICKNNNVISNKKHTFNGIPVSICELDDIEDTVYYKIKTLQDAYNRTLSDQCNTIGDYRNAYLIVSGVEVDEEAENKLKSHGLLNLPSANSSVKWLTKDMPDTYIQNMLNNLKSAMYSATNHIDGNEKLQSNTSGTALRNRLVFLEQRCMLMCNLVIDVIYQRIERLFEYLVLAENKTFDITDLKINSSPCIPRDEIGIVQMLSQLGISENISKETALSLLPFIENPLHEIEKINQEKQTSQEIDLDKFESIED